MCLGAWPDVLAIAAMVGIDAAGDYDGGGHGNRDGFAQLYCKGISLSGPQVLSPGQLPQAALLCRA